MEYFSSLSKKDVKVLDLLAKGISCDRIAERQDTSVKSIQSRINIICRKMEDRQLFQMASMVKSLAGARGMA